MLAMQSKQLSLAQDYDAQLNKKSVWKNYVTHNLALANAAQQDFKSAHQLWQGLLKQDDADVELALLQQRARLAQGLIFLQQQQLQQAQENLLCVEEKPADEKNLFFLGKHASLATHS
jgi:Flp pilus assembly protein TadD